MCIARLFTFLAICICFCACGGAPTGTSESANVPALSVSQKQIKVVRSAGNSSNISPAEVDANFNAVNDILSTDDGRAKDGDGDFACPIQIVREGDITMLPHAVIPTVVKNKDDFDKICNTGAGFVYIVDRIEWCNRISTDGSIRGCSDLSGKCMVVTRPASDSLFTPDLEGILWAHEYVHTVGNRDSCTLGCLPNHLDKLMYPVIALDHRKVTRSESIAILR